MNPLTPTSRLALLILEKHGAMTLAQLQEATGVTRYGTIRDTMRLLAALNLVSKDDSQKAAVFTIAAPEVL